MKITLSYFLLYWGSAEVCRTTYKTDVQLCSIAEYGRQMTRKQE